MMLGSAAAPRASQWLIDGVGWRWTFATFALLGVAWAIAFYLWFRDDPSQHPTVNEAERRLIAAGRKNSQPARTLRRRDGWRHCG